MMSVDPLSISSDEEAFDALRGLSLGDTTPLAEYLELGTGALHPVVQRELASMLRGTHKTHRLDLLGARRGRPPKKAGTAKGWKGHVTSDEVVEFLQKYEGSPATAKRAATQRFGLSTNTLRVLLKDFRDRPARLRRMLRHHMHKKT
jgi:hypothetical protein